MGFICSYRSRGTLMSYTDRSVQRRFKSNTPTVRTQAEHEKHCATRQSEGFSICTIAIIYHGFTVVTFTALWYCGRNLGYSHLILLQE